MKHVLVTVISIYQAVLSPLVRQVIGVKSQCRYPLSCSAYAKQVITDHGSLKGLGLATQRILSCQPFSHSYGHN